MNDPLPDKDFMTDLYQTVSFPDLIKLIQI